MSVRKPQCNANTTQGFIVLRSGLFLEPKIIPWTLKRHNAITNSTANHDVNRQQLHATSMVWSELSCCRLTSWLAEEFAKANLQPHCRTKVKLHHRMRPQRWWMCKCFATAAKKRSLYEEYIIVFWGTTDWSSRVVESGYHFKDWLCVL